jgi:hypothetical protein
MGGGRALIGVTLHLREGRFPKEWSGGSAGARAGPVRRSLVQSFEATAFGVTFIFGT